MPVGIRDWIKNWIFNRQQQFQNNYNEYRDIYNQGLDNFNQTVDQRNKRLQQSGSTKQISKYTQEDYIPEYDESYINNMLNKLDTIQEFTPTSFSSPGGEQIKKEANELYWKEHPEIQTDEYYNAERDIKKKYFDQYKKGIISEQKRNDLIRNDIDQYRDKVMNLPFYKAKENITWLGKYFPNTHTIIYKDNSPTVRVHELTHSLNIAPNNSKNLFQTKYNKPQNQAIKSRLQLKEGVQGSRYWDNPEEVYSRLMQIRHDAGLDPNKKLDIEDINSIRKDKVIKNNPHLNEYFMDRYSDDSLLKIFNEVAQNKQNVDSYNSYAKKGTKLIKRKFNIL